MWEAFVRKQREEKQARGNRIKNTQGTELMSGVDGRLRGVIFTENQIIIMTEQSAEG